jgi:CheY-like chemotaxis protein
VNQSGQNLRIDCLLEPCESAGGGEAPYRRSPEAASGRINTAHGIEPNGLVKATVLLVEFGHSMGPSLQTVLSRFRLTFSKATRSEEVLSILRSSHFDAALLNINRSGLRGTDICRRLRRDSPRLPIIVLGDSNDEDQVLEAFEAKADDYIAKPFPSES